MNKRANGEGSLRKRPDGRWEGRYTVGIDPKTGKRISKSVFGKTQAECKNKLRTAIAENRGPAINFKGDYTVGEWMWLWYETYSKPNIRATTQDNYENYIRNHIEPGLGHIKLKNLTPSRSSSSITSPRRMDECHKIARRMASRCPTGQYEVSTRCCVRQWNRQWRNGSSTITPVTASASHPRRKKR